MTTLFVVVPLALLVSTLAVLAFVWSVKHGQLDDLSTPALRMLEEETRQSKAAPQSETAQQFETAQQSETARQFETAQQFEAPRQSEAAAKSRIARESNLH